MKATISACLTLLLALGARASAVPADEFDLLQSQFEGLQTVISSTDRLNEFAHGVLGNIENEGKNALKNGKNILKGAKGRVERWAESGREFVKQQGQTCTRHPLNMRLVSLNSSLQTNCSPTLRSVTTSSA